MKNVLFLSTLFVILASCEKYQNLEKIDSNVLVAVESVDNNITILGKTEVDYPTLGHVITFCQKVRKNEIYIKFKKVRVPDIGLTALGPALCEIRFDDLENGEYEVTFELNKQKTKGKLIIGSAAQLTLESGGNVKPN